MKQRIRELLHTMPFEPFTIRMADGRAYRVDHPDFVWASGSERPNILIEMPDGAIHNLSELLITSVEEHASRIREGHE